MLYKLSKGVNKLANKKDINEDINESDKVFRKVVLSWYIPTLINFPRKPYFTRVYI